ncbi:MAG TPA: hypothetical protein VEU06_05965 [Micropepsaceae bacterium]|nr:hypothetical protein [Micropepsaceae bacterium]
MTKLPTLSAVAVLVIGAACSSPGPRARPGAVPPPITDLERDVRLMLSYDANGDGTVTRQELDEGLHRQFAICDVNGDGRLDSQETQAENQRRFMANGTLASPLIDWNQDGFVSFEEFATTAHSVFDGLDKDKDGRLTPDELRLPRGRGGFPGMPVQGERGRRGG